MLQNPRKKLQCRLHLRVCRFGQSGKVTIKERIECNIPAQIELLMSACAYYAIRDFVKFLRFSLFPILDQCMGKNMLAQYVHGMHSQKMSLRHHAFLMGLAGKLHLLSQKRILLRISILFPTQNNTVAQNIHQEHQLVVLTSR